MHFEKLVEAVKERRNSLNVNQDLLAELSGLGLRTIKQFESGKGNPTLSTLVKLSDALGMEVVLKVKSLSPEDEAS